MGKLDLADIFSGSPLDRINSSTIAPTPSTGRLGGGFRIRDPPRPSPASDPPSKSLGLADKIHSGAHIPAIDLTWKDIKTGEVTHVMDDVYQITSKDELWDWKKYAMWAAGGFVVIYAISHRPR